MNLHEIFLASQISGKSNGNGESADLSDYYTKTETDSRISEKVAEVASQAAINKTTLGYSSKNLLKLTAVSGTRYGLTYTVNVDGSVTVNGTATESVVFQLGSITPNENTKYTLSGCSTGGTYATYQLCCRTSDGAIQGTYEYGDGVEFERSEAFGLYIRIGNGYTTNNLKFHPMIRYAEITDDTYEPYKPSVEERLTALENAILGGI